MKQEGLQELFKKHKEAFTNQETPLGHQKRFLDRLQTHKPKKKYNKGLWLSIAASLVLFLGIAFTVTQARTVQNDLASVSPEMEATQSFFTNAIKKELNKLKAFEDATSKKMIEDALVQLNKLEKEYDTLKVDLIESGQNKKVIAAMIQNFQNRIDLLHNVSSQIEAFNNLKSNPNENTL